jgi:ABC-2 type transport system ATP-binding protein
MSAIVVDHLVKRFGSFTAVADVSFDVPAGRVAALLGPNGAGKTTTIEILEGFLAPSGGGARVLGADPSRAGRAWRARIGLVLQSTSLDTQLSVIEAVRLYAGLFARPMPPGEVLDVIDLASDAGTRIGALSGGQRRRVDLGLGIIGRPEVLFLDEPTTGLDPEARRGLWTVGSPVIRFHVPPDASDLPPQLAQHLDARSYELSVPSADVTADLAALVDWARRNRVDLTGLEVAPPSLEDAYLALTGSHG